MAGAIFGSQFVVRVMGGRYLETMADGRMDFLHRRIDAYAIGPGVA
jgi:hypothetical protein